MSKVLVGIVSYGNLPFTKLTVQSFRETVVEHNVDFFLVVGKPNDFETRDWLKAENIPYIMHTENWGFPCSLNDVYDYAWVLNDYDNLIVAGNDIYAYPYAVDSLIKLADESEYEVISALQVDVRALVKSNPHIAKYFSGSNFTYTDFGGEVRPWDVFTEYADKPAIADMQLFDIQNLCLYKKGAFEKLGYTDVNFYPAYYIDNDYARRIVNAGIKCCTVVTARFFHFWSRTIHQGEGGSNSHFFEANRRYYIRKWNGDFGKEKYSLPFDGKPYALVPGVILEGSLKISSRDNEKAVINYWRSR